MEEGEAKIDKREFPKPTGRVPWVRAGWKTCLRWDAHAIGRRPAAFYSGALIDDRKPARHARRLDRAGSSHRENSCAVIVFVNC
jgi:hypothetical protein